jgi:hypothetical protein
MRRAKFVRDNLQVGDNVQVIEPVEAYYSNYGANKGIDITLTPDIIGTVGKTRVPVVWRAKDSALRRPYDEFVCVDFMSPATGRIERASVSYDNILIYAESEGRDD